MTIKMIIKIKNFFLILGFLGLFILGQLPINGREVVYSIWEVFIMANILFTTQYFAFSRYGFNTLGEDGLKISYNLYQYIGLLISFLISSTVILALAGCCSAT